MCIYRDRGKSIGGDELMKEYREISRIVKGKKTVDGAGVNLTRIFSRGEASNFDPFLMLDSFDSKDPEDYIKGFPRHPHRGIETITYLVKGEIQHEDSIGNQGSIFDGDCQWMTGGSGIIHQEMPIANERMLGVQLWLNLPAKDKMTEPQYRDILSKDIPLIEEETADIRIISGDYKGTLGAIQGDYVKPLFLDINLKGNQIWEMETKPESTLFIFTLEGQASFSQEDDQYIEEKSAVLFKQGKDVFVKAPKEGARLLLLMGEPLNEPIAWGGPIVMNTQEELKQAFEDFDKGTFIR